MAHVWTNQRAKRSTMCERRDAQMEPITGAI